MAASKDVLTVLGMMCISGSFRTEFFANPQIKAESLVGKLRPDEVTQIKWLAGIERVPVGLTRDTFIARLDGALANVWAAVDCPDPPCPENPFASPAP